jgi:hypothetical protein
MLQQLGHERKQKGNAHEGEGVAEERYLHEGRDALRSRSRMKGDANKTRGGKWGSTSMQLPPNSSIQKKLAEAEAPKIV